MAKGIPVVANTKVGAPHWHNFRPALGLLLLLICSCTLPQPTRQLATPTAIAVAIDAAHIPLKVAIATTPQEQAQGLMFVKHLADDQGMLFVYDRPQRQSFWMKNTPLSLDILFFDNERILVNMHTNTKPGSLQPLRSAGAARYVLEMKAGFVARHGIAPGDRLVLDVGTKKGE